MFEQTLTGTLLHEDHMATIQLLQELEQFVVKNRAVPDLTQSPVRQLLMAVIALADNEVVRHFGFEEEHLFPHFGEDSGMVMLLKGEHADIRPLALRLRELAAEALETGFEEAKWKEFRTAAAEMVEREVFHIQKEEMGLLAAIAMTLDPELDGDLAEKFRALAAA